jgi:hypothetical protein
VQGLPADHRASGWSLPLTLLPRPLFEAARPARAILLGWLTAFIPSILLSALVASMLPTLGQPQLALGTGAAVVLVAVVAAVLASAAGWGIAHSLAAPAWGLVIWWPFLIFSTLYVTWRQRSLLAALAVPASVHGLQNLLPAALVYSGLGA